MIFWNPSKLIPFYFPSNRQCHKPFSSLRQFIKLLLSSTNFDWISVTPLKTRVRYIYRSPHHGRLGYCYLEAEPREVFSSETPTTRVPKVGPLAQISKIIKVSSIWYINTQPLKKKKDNSGKWDYKSRRILDSLVVAELDSCQLNNCLSIKTNSGEIHPPMDSLVLPSPPSDGDSSDDGSSSLSTIFSSLLVTRPSVPWT